MSKNASRKENQQPSKKSGKKRSIQRERPQKSYTQEITGLFIVAFGIFLILCVLTTSVGIAGEFLKSLLFGIFGLFGYVIPILVTLLGGGIIAAPDLASRKRSIFLWTLFAVCIFTFIHLFYIGLLATDAYWAFIVSSYDYGQASLSSCGALGAILAYPLYLLVGKWGSVIVLLTICVAIVIIETRLSLAKMSSDVKTIGEKVVSNVNQNYQNTVKPTIRKTKNLFIAEDNDVPEYEENNHYDLELLGSEPPEEPQEKKQPYSNIQFYTNTNTSDKHIFIASEDDVFTEQTAMDLPKNEADTSADAQDGHTGQGGPADKSTGSDMAHVNTVVPKYVIPPIDLLINGQRSKRGSGQEDYLANAKKLEETLASFGISAEVVQITHGPAITRYELQPAPGVKISRIVSLSNDIAMRMAASGVRIEAPIPGKAAIGIEIPNQKTQMVRLREVLESTEFNDHKSKVAVALGKDISGTNIIADLSQMPHTMIAGATGSGKSVCINSIVLSIIYRASPSEVRMIMVDPKVVELSVYNGIPHLLIPVVTDPKKAAGALNWAVNEMTNRYQLFAEKKCRNMEQYNQVARDAGEEPLPQILIIIDELADLMMVAPNDVEDAICRLAQMARAAGMYLVIATQRPSVDVITGIIKANIPSRIAFSVSSQIDSRTILDMGGAERLLGKGDMLYSPSDFIKPLRVQGCFVSEKEIESVVSFLQEAAIEQVTDRSHEIITDMENYVNSEKKGNSKTDRAAEKGYDALLADAFDIVHEQGAASISMLQRRLRVGYARAARIIDEMELLGIVSSGEGSKTRTLLKTKAEAMRIIQGEDEDYDEALQE